VRAKADGLPNRNAARRLVASVWRSESTAAPGRRAGVPLGIDARDAARIDSIRIFEYPHRQMRQPDRFFRALGDRTRLRIINLLARRSLCVCDIQRILDQPQPSVSRHLALLKSAGLIGDRRDGMRIFYALTAWDSPLARGVLSAVRGDLAVEGDYLRDMERLEQLCARGDCHEQPASWRRGAHARRTQREGRIEA
jgi:ArsR family transcriptional regulator